MNIYELFGHLAEERQTEHDQHLRTLSLLMDLKSGKRTLEEVEVTPIGWRIVEPQESPES